MGAALDLPVVPVGQIKSFGAFGPKYKIIKPVRPLKNGDWMIEISLIETGENVEYRLTRIQHDPEAS